MDELVIYTKEIKLLYVEDDPEARETTLLLLKEFFENIVVAVDGKDALDKFQENEIEMIISDINMPNMDGLTMVDHIKKIDKNIPVLIFSAYNESAILQKSIKIGVEGYLSKPINFEQFTEVIKKCTERLYLRKENQKYKDSLELKVQTQLKELRNKDLHLLKQSRMAAMGEMIDVITHQWMQPLNVITMQSDMLKLFVKDGTIEYERVEICGRNVKEQVAHLVDTLGEFRKFYRSNHNIDSLDIGALLNSITVLVGDDLRKQSVKLHIECEDNLSVEANENDIKHLFINLINNAKDEMVISEIDYDHRNIFIRCRSDQDSVNIEIEDSGNGIADELKTEIFDMNFTTKEESGGTGMGLYMSKQIVDKYGGEISVSNAQDSGAIFEIEFKK